ncbi:uncharacterized protein RCC_08582 [Ramularia collo-cygni]|uniref:A-kinase anchor protein 7-like phosphoesterase domain-containing protein n=1 Tax=Ramularia collo-cygni TaxID=112498 RepID=A0A2D3V0H3_9PEZI|nr:uncharacterized protein RCC_08582 [Ramularia collo-cygni]CZT22876.1 uncharacterized protein RCC_08582 [Ramularia collo-cygni]
MVGPNPPSKSQWQKKPTLSHFLCLPLVTEISRPQLDRSLGQFKAEVCADGPGDLTTRDESGTSAAAQSLSAKAIRPLGTLHLTLGVMTLNQDQLAKAVELLRSLDVATLLQPSSVDSKSESESGQSQNTTAHALTIDLKGLESMHDPESTSILYVAPSDRTERLYAFCLALQRHFEEFIVSDDRPLKLHATIVNTIYAKSKNSASRSQGHGPKARGSSKIDATAVLRKYHDFVWAENFRLDRIAICEMGAKKIMDAAKVRVVEERYTEVASAALPS